MSGPRRAPTRAHFLVALFSSPPQEDDARAKIAELRRKISEKKGEIAGYESELEACKNNLKSAEAAGDQALATELKANIRSKEGLLASSQGLVASRITRLTKLEDRLETRQPSMSELTTSTPIPFVCSPHRPSPSPSLSPSPAFAAARPASKSEREAGVATRFRHRLPPHPPPHPQARLEEALTGAEPITDAHLGLLKWKAPTMPWGVRCLETEEDESNERLTGDAGQRNMVQGWKVAYVRPAQTLDEVMRLLQSGLHHDSDKRCISRPYIFGPSGCGKSRIGWEAYLELKRKFEKKPNGSLPALGNVVYFSVTIGRPLIPGEAYSSGVRSTREIVHEIVGHSASDPSQDTVSRQDEHADSFGCGAPPLGLEEGWGPHGTSAAH